jgi:hypothetical protein
MEDKILIIYCLTDDILKFIRNRPKSQIIMTDAEVITTAIVAAYFFRGNFESARDFLKSPQYIPYVLSKSQFNWRLHGLTDLIVTLNQLFAELFKQQNNESLYLLDSFPIGVCDNIRISRCKIYPKNEKYRGYIASKRRYFYGVRVHILVTRKGEPVEFFIVPGSTNDVNALRIYQFDLPVGSKLIGDAAFTDYVEEEILLQAGIELLPVRKKNSKRQFPPFIDFLQHYNRQYVETVGSMIERKLPKSIHAVTPQGFELKILLFITAYSFSCLIEK